MLKPETELEWRLLGLLAALLGVASKEFAASACRAAELDAEEIISLVRNDPNYKEVPIVIITTEGANEDKERAMAIGANDYILECK